jgi:hypothetical protein
VLLRTGVFVILYWQYGGQEEVILLSKIKIFGDAYALGLFTFGSLFVSSIF